MKGTDMSVKVLSVGLCSTYREGYEAAKECYRKKAEGWIFAFVCSTVALAMALLYIVAHYSFWHRAIDEAAELRERARLVTNHY